MRLDNIYIYIYIQMYYIHTVTYMLPGFIGNYSITNVLHTYMLPNVFSLTNSRETGFNQYNEMGNRVIFHGSVCYGKVTKIKDFSGHFHEKNESTTTGESMLEDFYVAWVSQQHTVVKQWDARRKMVIFHHRR